MVSKHAVEKWSLKDFEQILKTAVNTLDHFPSISQLEIIAGDLKLTTGNWKYFAVSACETCGGVGWHWLYADGKKGVCACDDCMAGENMQKAPRPHISSPFSKFPNAIKVGEAE